MGVQINQIVRVAILEPEDDPVIAGDVQRPVALVFTLQQVGSPRPEWLEIFRYVIQGINGIQYTAYFLDLRLREQFCFAGCPVPFESFMLE